MDRPEVLQTGSLPDWDEAPLADAHTVHRLFDAPDRAALLAAVGPRVRAIVTRGDLGADAALIAACPALELVAVFGVGYDAVDVDALRVRGIRLANTPDVLTGDCADLAVAIALAQTRGIVGAEAFLRAGQWERGLFPLQRRFWGRRAGILGLGRIGMAVAERLAGFGMTIAYAARSQKPVPWAYESDPVALAARSDVLFVTLAASAETRGIVSRAVIAALGPEGLLVNISRAANVDEEALIEALASGALGGAALDVFAGEPRLDPRFLTLPNVLLQPHVASGTVETRRAMGQLLRDNLAAHFAGRPLPSEVAL
jgi:lactate dehydrogenase-like 2-hydroxyacid dehydrogenase